MPDPAADASLDALIRRTEETLRRIDKQCEGLESAIADCQKINALRADLPRQINTSTVASQNLAFISRQAIKLEGAYRRNSDALVEYSGSYNRLQNIDIALSVAYFIVGVGKLVDLFGSATGAGKWIATAKSAVIDVATEVQKGVAPLNPGDKVDPGMIAAQTANLALIAVGEKFVPAAGLKQAGAALDLAQSETQLLDMLKDVQAAMSAIIDLIKDSLAIISAQTDLKKTRGDIGQMMAKLSDKLAKLVDIAGKAWKLMDSVDRLGDRFNNAPVSVVGVKGNKFVGTGSLTKDLSKAVGRGNYSMQFADYMSVVKYAIEAAQNFYQAWRAGQDACNMGRERDALLAMAARNLAPTGGGQIDMDQVAISHLTRAALVSSVSGANSAEDARELAAETGMKAMQLAGDIKRLRQMTEEVNTRVQPSRKLVEEMRAQMAKSDQELQTLRVQLDGRRAGAGLRVPVALDLVDRERRMIAKLIAAD